MNVSLCGPHSFETSTFAPTASEEIPPGLGSEPFFSRNWYLSHHVGSLRIESARASWRTPTATIRSDGTIFEFMETSWVLGRDDGVRLPGDLLEPHGRELALRAACDQDGRDDGQDQADAENDPFDDRLVAVPRGGESRLAAGRPDRDVDSDHRDDPDGGRDQVVPEIHGGEPVDVARDGVREDRSEEHTSELQSPDHLVCRLLLEKKKKRQQGRAQRHPARDAAERDALRQPPATRPRRSAPQTHTRT